MKGFYGFVHKIFARPFRFIFNLKIDNPENEPKAEDGSYILCSNHMSAWDPVWLCASLKNKQPHFMAKAELFKIPLLGWLIRKLGAYPIQRGSADVSSLRTTFSLIKDGNCIAMFPQGTRCKGVNPKDTKVKSGIGTIAIRAGVPVLPVFIRTKGFKSTAFGRKHIVIGKPIPFEVLYGMHEQQASYLEISKYIFNEICSLDSLSADEETCK